MEEKQGTQKPVQTHTGVSEKKPENHADNVAGAEHTSVSAKHVAPPIKNKWPAIIIGIVVVIAVIAGAIWLWWRFVQPAFTIGDKNYSKTQYNKMMAAANKNGVGKAEATARYIEIEKQRIAAEQLKITPTQTQTQTAQTNLYPKQDPKTYDVWQQELVFQASLTPAINFAKTGGYNGYIFYFPFSRLQEPASGAYRGNLEGFRNPVKVAEDRDYAKTKADEYYKKIKDGYSQQEATKEIRNDARLKFAGSGNPTGAFEITTTNNTNIQNNSVGISQIISDIPVNGLNGENSIGLSQILTGKVVLFDLTNKPKVDAYFYFYDIDSFSNANTQIQAQFDELVKNMKVRKNV